MRNLAESTPRLIGFFVVGALVVLAIVLAAFFNTQSAGVPSIASISSAVTQGDAYPPPGTTQPPYPPPATPTATPTPKKRGAPAVIIEPLGTAILGDSARLVTVPTDQPEVPGELCDLRPSPNGEWVAITMCATELVLSNVYLVNPAQGTVVFPNIIHESGTMQPTWFRGWFADSRRILLMSDRLEIRDILTGERQQITPQSTTVTDAAISPDGHMIAYTTIQGDRISIIDPTGNLLRDIAAPTPKPGSRPEGMAWAPDGRSIAYIWDQTVIQFNTFGPLWIADAQTGIQRALSPDQVYDGFPSWSPQGSEIVVVRRENMADRSADFDLNRLVSSLWLVNASTGEWRQLAQFAGKGVWSPVWSPNGAAIAFMTNTSTTAELWTVPVRRGNPQRLVAASGRMLRAFALIR